MDTLHGGVMGERKAQTSLPRVNMISLQMESLNRILLHFLLQYL